MSAAVQWEVELPLADTVLLFEAGATAIHEMQVPVPASDAYEIIPWMKVMLPLS